jgi:hypothetical protein
MELIGAKQPCHVYVYHENLRFNKTLSGVGNMAIRVWTVAYLENKRQKEIGWIGFPFGS